MFLSFHFCIGALLGVQVSPLLLVAAYLSHYALDLIGESNPYGKYMHLIDSVLFTGGVLLFLLYQQNYFAIVCGLLACLIDFIDKFREYVLKKPQLADCHQKWYPNFNISRSLTLALNLLAILAVVSLL